MPDIKGGGGDDSGGGKLSRDDLKGVATLIAAELGWGARMGGGAWWSVNGQRCGWVDGKRGAQLAGVGGARAGAVDDAAGPQQIDEAEGQLQRVVARGPANLQGRRRRVLGRRLRWRRRHN